MRKRQKSLRQWQEMFKKIYGGKNKRHYIPADLLLHIVEETAAIAEYLRKEDGTLLKIPLARLFSWLLAFATSLNINMERAVFQKYQGLCPYCGRKKNCICISSEKKPLRWFRSRNGRIPNSLSGWQCFFKKIYGNVNKVAGRDKIWLHLLEEIGELSRAFRLKKRKAIREELADVFAWFISFSNQLNLNLDEIISQTYPGKCDTCKEIKCKCPLV